MKPPIPDLILARRSIRAFTDEPVDDDLVDMCIEAACLAPAPHKSRPWRWVRLGGPARKAMAESMADAWRDDLCRDGTPASDVAKLVDASTVRISSAPAAVLGCLTNDGLDSYPDPRRQEAETTLALLSLGAGVENLMLAAAAAGLGSCWIAAPVFCPEAARDALALLPTMRPVALVLIGHPAPGYQPFARAGIDLDEMRPIR